jgi:two-component system, chemotaxis family, chemotaxis protein CheY
MTPVISAGLPIFDIPFQGFQDSCDGAGTAILSGMLRTDAGAANHHDNAVLIVEDNDDFREVLENVLTHAGYRTVACASAMDGLLALQTGERFCAIVLDLRMPHISGFQFREEQRRHPALRDIPVIVVTATVHPADYHGNLNAAAYLTKPVNLADMLETVRRHCPLPAEVQH